MATKATMHGRVRQIEAQAEALVTRSRNSETKYCHVSKLLHRVVVAEHQRLMRAEQEYSDSDYNMRQASKRCRPRSPQLLLDAVDAETEQLEIKLRGLRLRRLQMSYLMCDSSQNQQLQQALKAPGMLLPQAEEQLYEAVLQRLDVISRCNRRMYAGSIKHLATRTNRTKLHMQLNLALYSAQELQQPGACPPSTVPASADESLLLEQEQQLLVQSLVDEALQADAFKQQLTQAVDDFNSLKNLCDKEISEFSRAIEEEAGMVCQFLEKMSSQLTASERQLRALLQELKDQAASAHDLMAAADYDEADYDSC